MESPDDILKNLELSLAIGTPVPRILFAAMVEASQAPDSVKNGWRQELEQELAAEGTGCIRVELPNAQTVYLVLDECGPDHDLTAELGKVYSRIPECRHEEIRQHLGALVFLGRFVYDLSTKKTKCVHAVAETIPTSSDEVFDCQNLKVDNANTTLYLPHIEDRRVGIYVRFAT